MKKYAIGVDVGGTTVKLGLFTVAGELLEKWEIPTRKEEQGKHILQDIVDSVFVHSSARQINREEIEGIGIGVPGPVLEGGVVNKCINLGWGVFNVEEELKALSGIENVKAGNDANVAALGEMWQGGGKGFKDIVMVTLGTGVGGGVIQNEKILAGAFGAAGEIGHIKISKNETIACGCGKTGCLEQHASATGIARKAKELLESEETPSVLRNVDEVSAKDVFDAAKEGDELALQIVDFVGESLGLALSYISCVIDPQAFVIGGGVSKAGEILTDSIKKYYVENAFHASRDTEFNLATLGNDAGIFGAVKMILS